MLDFAPFTRHTAYTLWRLNPNPAPGKKPLKVPVHYDGVTHHSLGRPARGDKPAIAPNPAPPLNLAQAMQWLDYCRSTGVGHDQPGVPGFIGIGFRPAGTGLACVDIDDCIVDGQWAPHALEAMRRFPGALFELSTSGTGLHIWFTYSGASPGKHGKDPSGRYELYAEGQFLAAGTVLSGDATIDHTVAMHQFLSQHWPARTVGPKEVTAADWDEKSDAEKEVTKAELLDALRVLAGDNTYDYHEWAANGMRLVSLGEEVGNALWHEYSSWWPGYDYDDAEIKWGQLNPTSTDYRAIFEEAKRRGWVNPQSLEAHQAREHEAVVRAMRNLSNGFDFDEDAARSVPPRPAPAPRPAATTQRYPDAVDVEVREVPPPALPAAPVIPSRVAPAGFLPGFADPSVNTSAPPVPKPPSVAVPVLGADPSVPAVTNATTVLELDSVSGLKFVQAEGEGAKATLPNIVKALQGPESNVRIRYDEFQGRIVIGSKTGKSRALKDADSVRLRLNMEISGFKAIGKDLMDSAILYLADEDRYDSAIEWGRELKWDGVRRVTMALHRYYRVPDTLYTRACSEYLFTALAGRCMQPGCQADMALIFVGLQGARKTSAVSALAPMPDSFVSLNLGGRDDDTARRLRGKLVGELGEMRGRGERDVQSIREWITRRFESWVEKFEKFETRFPRRTIMVATVNEHEVLDDPEGERRWLPMVVGEVDVEGLEVDRDQLWAEGIAMWNEGGIRWQDAERLARAEHQSFKVHDEYIEKIEIWLAGIAVAKPGMLPGETDEKITGVPRGESPFTIAEVLTHCIGVPSDRHDRMWQTKVGKILRGLKYEKKMMWIDGRSVKRWVRVGT